MCKTFIVIYLICHLEYPTLRKDSFRFIQTVSGFTNCEVVNAISISHACWICFSNFTITLFCQFFLLFLGDRSIMLCDVVLLDSAVKIESLMTFFLPTYLDSVYLCGRFAAYFLEYSFSTLHYSEECTGPCSKHVLSAPVVFSLGETIFFVLHLLTQPLSGLVDKAASPPFIFLT